MRLKSLSLAITFALSLGVVPGLSAIAMAETSATIRISVNLAPSNQPLFSQTDFSSCLEEANCELDQLATSLVELETSTANNGLPMITVIPI